MTKFNFKPEDFFNACVNGDAIVGRTAVSTYLDAARMGEYIKYRYSVLSVEEADGTRRHFRVTFEELPSQRPPQV